MARKRTEQEEQAGAEVQGVDAVPLEEYETALTSDEGPAVRAARLRLHALGWATSWIMTQDPVFGVFTWYLRAQKGGAVLLRTCLVELQQLRQAHFPEEVCRSAVLGAWEEIEAAAAAAGGQPDSDATP